MSAEVSSSERSLVLVHGSWHGAWCWERIVDPLKSAGIDVFAVNLPLTSLEDDTAEVRRVVASAGPDVVVCGHSYGGRLTSIVSDGAENVSHVVYLSSQAPNAKQLVAYRESFRPGSMEIPDAQTLRAKYYSECSEADVEAAAARMRPMFSVPGSPEGLEFRPWEHIRSTYIVCTLDHAIEVDRQRAMAANMDFITVVRADHAPFYSASGELIEALASIVRDDRPSGQSESASTKR
ncbi:MAG: alpha/beta fold hydrolase [Actinomycetota bacterium]